MMYTSATMRLLALGAILLLSASVLPATVIYNFDFAPSSGPIQAFTFQFQSPDFLGVGPISFSPFNITDGATTFVVTRGVAGVNQISSCFLFATANTSNLGIHSDCTGGFDFSPPTGALLIFTFCQNPCTPVPPPQLPTIPGTYITPLVTIFETGIPEDSQSHGVVTLMVTDTSIPEVPTSLLLGTGFGALLTLRVFSHRSSNAAAVVLPRWWLRTIRRVVIRQSRC